MPIAPIKAGGWAVGEILTSDQMDALQAALLAIDVREEDQNDLQVAAALVTLANRALCLRHVDLDAGTTADVAESMAAVRVSEAEPNLLMKTDFAMQLFDRDGIGGNNMASITSLCNGAAYNGTNRIVAIGSGGNFCCLSTDNGDNWSAGGSIGSAALRIVWNDTYGRFMVCLLAGVNASHSTNAVAWTAVTTTLDDVLGGLAVLANGNTIACGEDGGVANRPAFARSLNGGTSWAATGGTVADAAGFSDSGSVAGNASAVVWHVGVRNFGSTLRLSSSADGITWTTLKDIEGPLVAFSGRPRLLCCQNTGLLVIVAPLSGGNTALYASEDAGVTWTAPRFAGLLPTPAFGLAGGRLFATRNALFFASDGIGF